MVKIRLRRTGAKKQPHYRVVVTDAKMPRDGRFIEVIGHYNPRTDPPTVEIDTERALHWLSVGAQPSAAVKRLFDRQNITAQVGAVRKGEVSIKDLAAEFRQTHAEEEAALASRGAGAAAILEPMFLGEEEAEAEEPTPAEEQPYPPTPGAAVPDAETTAVPFDVAEFEEEEDEDFEFDDDDEDDDEDEDEDNDEDEDDDEF